MGKRGFSLIEVLVGIVLFGIIAAGFASLMARTSNDMKRVDAKQNYVSLANEIKTQLEVADRCRTVLQGQAITTAAKNPVSINLGNGTTLTNNLPLQKYKIYLQELYFDQRLAGGTATSGNPQGIASLYMKGATYDGAKVPGTPEYSGAQFAPTLVTSIAFEYDASGRVTNCKSATGPAEICASLNGTFDTSTQKCTLPTPAPATVDAQTTCASLGGTWNGSACAFASTGGQPDIAMTCSQLGGIWNGSTCGFAGTGGGPGNNGGDGTSGGSCNKSSFATHYTCTHEGLIGSGLVPGGTVQSGGELWTYGTNTITGGNGCCVYKCVSSVWLVQRCHQDPQLPPNFGSIKNPAEAGRYAQLRCVNPEVSRGG